MVSPAHKPLKGTALFSPVDIGAISLSHRVVQAPLTRMRAVKEADGIYVPGDLMLEYYSQRATEGGLILTEATDIAHYASGYPGTPGVFSDSQVAGWKKITTAVHAKGGSIFCQIWHTGRASPPSLRNGAPAPSSGTIPISGNALDGTEYSANPPYEMSKDDILKVTKDFASAAKRAIEAGFDGVEIHGANGYLLDQFLHDNVNKRTDEYGASVEGRGKFLLEVITAVSAAIGPARVGVRLSPYNYFQDTKDSSPVAHWKSYCQQIAALSSKYKPAYVHMVEPRFDEVLDESQKLDALSAYASNDGPEAEVTLSKKSYSLDPFRTILRQAGISFLAAGGFNRENALTKIEQDTADAIIMGRHFISNPDLITRLAEGLELNAYDRSTFYGADPPSKGYTDYPVYGAA